MRWLMPPNGLVETVPAPIITVTDVGAISTDGVMAHVYYYALKPDFYEGDLIKDVVIVVQRPLASIIDSVAKMKFLLDENPTDGPPCGGSHLRLVK